MEENNKDKNLIFDEKERNLNLEATYASNACMTIYMIAFIGLIILMIV